MENEKYEVSELTNRVMTCVDQGDMKNIKVELSGEDLIPLILSATEVISRVAVEQSKTIYQAYIEEIMARERSEMRNIQQSTEIFKRFNDQVEKAMQGLDLSNAETVRAFDIVCGTLRKNMEGEFDKNEKQFRQIEEQRPSLIKRLFSRRKNGY